MRDQLKDNSELTDLQNEILRLKEARSMDNEQNHREQSSKNAEIEKLKAEVQSLATLRETNEKLDRELKHGKFALNK